MPSINYPTSLDDATTVAGDALPVAGTALSETGEGHPAHAELHENLGDAVQALEAKVGVNSSTPVANGVLASTATGQSDWTASPVVTTLTATNITLDGTDLGEIETFTPTWTNVSGTHTTNSGHYARIKDIVVVFIELEFGATSSVSGDVYVDLPVVGTGDSAVANGMLSVQVYDQSTNKTYSGLATAVDTDTVAVRYNIVDGSNIIGQPLNPSGPILWAENDKILITGMYRVSS